MSGYISYLFEPAVLITVGIIDSVILLAIAALHFYWAMGGKKGIDACIPVINGVPLFHVTAGPTFFVAFAALLASLLILGRTGIFGVPDPEFPYVWAPYVLTVLFFFRAQGDFKYVGIFKRYKFSYFSWWDNRLFIPLCLVLFLLNLLIALSPVPWR